MVKVLFLIYSKEMLESAITIALNSYKNKRYEDVKVIFLGEAVKNLITLSQEASTNLEELSMAGVIDSVCFYSADKAGIKDDIVDKGITLAPIGERMAKYINSGYTVLTF
ncbi:DsrE family protein [Sulfuracidifex metallicus]|uniref:Uncharacterized protein n=1 Tax=Sulfuracidifex metallicus DSM 6482 = JCM 9184 TaxID=523847 RepID=A0A6A9QNZ4_SULME|nr:DsrE family protein [Sulfuracidifex metallicus]MUN28901.1 hypothetical protein [Sulfuracidifex metallicus DSM 6482 = JCM 9184]WOE50588.1 DsrE family protein [Sulfuracidifex metallicus DSM 6482 = JCM 9184]